MVGFRDILAHGYATIDDARVWTSSNATCQPCTT
ncbi:MAG TPA: HepT-like ribonuclease domain-containing protein [Pseudonocardia sp.]|nr:HepT-like ribonuclease domain-containing protein [Pseudonocardia sp.]